MKIALSFCLLLTIAILAFSQGGMMPGPGTPHSAGGASLISEVGSGSQRKGQQSCSAPADMAFAGNVTSGNDIIVAIIIYHSSAPGVGTPSKASGTATIGSFVDDKNYANNDGAGNFFDLSIWRAPVTGTGSLTLSFSLGGTCNIEAIDEFHRTSGSISVDGTPAQNTGTSSTESTGAITTSTGGLVVMVSSELAASDFTYTLSDTAIYSISTASSTFTGESQFKITSGSGSPNLTAGIGSSMFWVAAGVAYK